jgi:hypothetical protein
MIPTGHTPSDFTLYLGWLQSPHAASDGPGFYLRAGFANEGSAHPLFNHRVSGEQLADVLLSVADCEGTESLRSVASDLAEFTTNYLQERLAAAEAREFAARDEADRLRNLLQEGTP